MIVTKQWADGPWELIPIPNTDPDSHPANGLVYLMAGIHNGFLRAINSAYLQAPYIKEPADKLDLAEYIETWVYVMHKHHTAEENIGFPGLVKLSDGEWEAQSAENLRQHAELDSKMDDLSAWCKQDTTQPRWTSILRSKIEIAMASVHPHLQDELPTLEELVKYDKAAIRAVIDEVEKDVQAKSDAFRDIPMLLGCHDNTFSSSKACLPPIPIPSVVRYVDHYILERRRRGVWRFNPCDSWSQPRDLHFLP